ncbi:MAG: DUF5103 domain-containing protein [Bacteroidetes bacterium]|nr:MAG: DUF5103 domain-containing protein [Bacteroidota bacterium]
MRGPTKQSHAMAQICVLCTMTCIAAYRHFLPLLLCWATTALVAQPDEVRNPNIKSIKLFKSGNQISLAAIPLGTPDAIELHFDDLQTISKAYSYTYELRNADWSACPLSPMDYIKGFTQSRITQYRPSSVAFTRYTHYQINLPQQNSMPSRSGNYLLKVFENGDTSRLLFSRKLLIYQERVKIAGQVLQPFSPNLFRTHQKIVTNVNLANLDVFNPQQQIKLVVLQNYNWQTAQSATTPTFIRGKVYEYSNEENLVFEGGKEWRWLDLRSFRLQSDRVRSIDYKANNYDVYPVPDSIRSSMRYLFFRDLNGQYVVSTDENINPWWQTDYGNVHFTFLPGNPQVFAQKDIYLAGELTNYQFNEKNRMQWNPEINAYSLTLRLKNGYYNYAYFVKGSQQPLSALTQQPTEGNTWDAENQYLILFYFRAFGGRSDELLGLTEINSHSFITPPR